MHHRGKLAFLLAFAAALAFGLAATPAAADERCDCPSPPVVTAHYVPVGPHWALWSLAVTNDGCQPVTVVGQQYVEGHSNARGTITLVLREGQTKSQMVLATFARFTGTATDCNGHSIPVEATTIVHY